MTVRRCVLAALVVLVRGSSSPRAATAGDAAGVAVLVQQLGHEDPCLRGAAVIALGRVGAPAVRALPQLVSLLSDASAQVRQLAAVTLGGLGALGGVARAATLPPTRNLSDRDESVHRSASDPGARDGARPVPERCRAAVR